jgi:hypothetical protein
MQKSMATLAAIALGTMLAIGPAHPVYAYRDIQLAAVAPGMPPPPTYTPPAAPPPTAPIYRQPTTNDYPIPFSRNSPGMGRSTPRSR